MSFYKSFWPWTKFQRYEDQIEELKSDLAFEKAGHEYTRKDLQTHKDAAVKHTGDMRRITTILAMKSGLTFALLLFCLSGFGQPILRNLFTTNPPPLLSSDAGPMVTTNGAGLPEFSYNGGGLTNLSGFSPSSSNWIYALQTWTNDNGKLRFLASANAMLLPTNSPIWSNAFFIQKHYPSRGFGDLQIEHFTASTNNAQSAAGVLLETGAQNTTDGELNIFIDYENANGFPGRPYYLSPERWLTNAISQDSVMIGHPPGWGWIGTNTASTPNLNMQFSDSSYMAEASCPYLKYMTGSSIQDGFGTLLALTSCVSSTLIGPFMPTLQSSTNDTMLNALGSSWNNISHDNTFLGACLPNSTHGNGCTVIGSGVDLPTDGVNNQLNIGNLIWGTGLNQNNAVAATGTVTINGTETVNTGVRYLPQTAPTAGSIGGTVGSVTNIVIANVHGALFKYWSDGTTLWSQEIGTH